MNVTRIGMTLICLGAVAAGCGQTLPVGERELARGQFAEAAQLLSARADLPEYASPRLYALTAAAYLHLEDFAHAQSYLNKAEQALAEADDYDPLDAVRITVYRAHLLSEEGQITQAVTAYQQALDQLRALDAFQDVLAAECLEGYGVALANLGKEAEAEGALRQAVNTVEGHRNRYPLLYAECQVNLGSVLLRGGKVNAAQSHFTGATRVLRKAGLEATPEMVRALNGIAFTQYFGGQHLKAERTLEQALELVEETDRDRLTNAAKCHHDLGKVYQHTGRPDLAERAYKTSLELYEEALGPRDVNVAMVLQSYAGFLEAEGRVDEAQALADEANQILSSSGMIPR